MKVKLKINALLFSGKLFFSFLFPAYTADVGEVAARGTQSLKPTKVAQRAEGQVVCVTAGMGQASGTLMSISANTPH